MQWLWDWFRWLYEEHGINLTIFYDAFDRARFLEGMFTTFWMSVVCIVASVALGLVGAWLQGSPVRLLRWLVQVYVQAFRNTPPVVQIYFFYFALGPLMPYVQNESGYMEPLLNNVAWAIIAISLFAGAFNVEIFRAGIEAVPRNTIEAAESLGYNRLQRYVHVVLPLALRISLPALNNNLVNLVKTTTLAYVIAVPETLYVTSQIWGDEVNVPEMMNVLLLFYVGLVALLVYGMHKWERAICLPGYGR